MKLGGYFLTEEKFRIEHLGNGVLRVYQDHGFGEKIVENNLHLAEGASLSIVSSDKLGRVDTGLGQSGSVKASVFIGKLRDAGKHLKEMFK